MNVKKPIGLIATDVDGTLVKTDKTVSPASVSAIHRAMEAGVKVAIASGRAWNEMDEIFAKVPEVRYFICTNGAIVMDKLSHQCLYHEQMDKALALDCVEKLLGYDVYVEAYMEHEIYGIRLSPKQEAHFFNDHIRPHIVETRTFVPDLLHVLDRFVGGPEKIQIFYGDLPKRDQILADFQDEEYFDVLLSSEGNLEFVMPHVTKGTAVKALGERWGLGPDQIMTIGDAHNDLAMLAFADYSFAMANGDELVQATAKFQTSANDEEGFAKAVNCMLDASERWDEDDR